MKQMGYHEGYRYAHDEPNGYAAGQTYFPEGVARRAGTSNGQVRRAKAGRKAYLAALAR